MRLGVVSVVLKFLDSRYINSASLYLGQQASQYSRSDDRSHSRLFMKSKYKCDPQTPSAFDIQAQTLFPR
jgi:hypothetical protein